MITPEQIAEIRSNELLRNDILTALGFPPPPALNAKRERLWAVLNSKFVLLVLSAMLVTFLGNYFTYLQSQFREAEMKTEALALEKKRVKELSDRLTLEISYRFSATLGRLSEASKLNGDKATAASQKAVERAMMPFAFPMSDTFPALFPEFKSYSGLALIAELGRYAENGEKKKLEETLADASSESPRNLRRLQPLRRWSHEEIEPFFPRSARTRSAHGAGAPWRAPILVGGH